MESAPHQRLRPVTWPIWLAWVLVSALIPLCSTIFATALGKQFSRTAEYESLITTGLLALMALAVEINASRKRGGSIETTRPSCLAQAAQRIWLMQ